MDSTFDGSPQMTGPGLPSGFRGGFKGLAWVGGALASVAAAVIGVFLVVVFAASLAVIVVMGAGLVVFALLAARARQALRKPPAQDPQIIEAHNIGGHSWVAYGWDQQR